MDSQFQFEHDEELDLIARSPDEILDKEQIWFIHDFAQALPVKARVNKKDSTVKSKGYTLRNVTSDAYFFLEIVTSSSKGPLKPISKIILTVLTTLALRQSDEEKEKYFLLKPELRGRFVVFFTISELCRELGYNPNSMFAEVKEAFENLASQKVHEKFFKYSKKTKKPIMMPDHYDIIDQWGQIVTMDNEPGSSGFSGVYFAVLHSKVALKLSNKANLGWGRSAIYHELRGLHAIVYEFINSKHTILGKVYTFKLSELADLLTLSGTAYKKRDTIKKHLEQVQEKVGGFDFEIKRDASSDDYVVYMNYNHSKESEEEFEPFYRELAYYYGPETLGKADFTQEDMNVLCKELYGQYEKLSGKDTFEFGGNIIDPVEFAVDVSLYQVIKCNYRPTESTRKFVKFIFKTICKGNYEFPEGYRKFVTARNEDKKKKEVQATIAMEIKKAKMAAREEEELISSAFEDFWQEKISKDPELMTALRLIAREELLRDNPELERDLCFKMMIEHGAKTRCRKHFEEGTLVEVIENSVKSMKKLKGNDALMIARENNIEPQIQLIN